MMSRAKHPIDVRCEELGKSRHWLASRVGTSDANLSLICAWKHRPSPPLALSIRDALGFATLDEVYGVARKPDEAA